MPLPVSIKIHVTPLERGREKEGGGERRVNTQKSGGVSRWEFYKVRIPKKILGKLMSKINLTI